MWKDLTLKKMYYDHKDHFKLWEYWSFLKMIWGGLEKSTWVFIFGECVNRYVQFDNILLSTIVPLKCFIRQVWSLFFAYSGKCIAGLFSTVEIRTNLGILHIYHKWIGSYINPIQCITLNRRQLIQYMLLENKDYIMM